MQGSDRKVPHRTECIFTARTVVYEIVCRTIIAEEWVEWEKAVAGESNVPFFSMSGSEMKQHYVLSVVEGPL